MRTQAIILKKIPIREYDELVICYTKDAGKQVYQAKSVLLPTSKQAGHLDILNLVDFSLVHKNSHPIITSAYCLEAFPHLKSSLSAMAAAFFLLECFDKLIFEGEPDAKLWEFLLVQLRKYDKLGLQTNPAYAGLVCNLETAIVKTRQELLKILGYDPSMPIEHLANSQFRSLQFARQVVGLR
ncbi:MAG: DNA repair protein RecO [bacterium]|nr:DNA repair protein RecO [bacterium]